MAALRAFGMVLAVAGLATTAQAQSFNWGGTGSTTTTSDYFAATNWSNPAAAPPYVPGQSAIFAGPGFGSMTVTVTPNLTFPFMFASSWTFTSDAQSYTINGTADLDFSMAGPTGGLINNANTGQTITINNNINDGLGGAVSVQQLGNSTLVLAGANGYTGGTLISAGIVQVTNANSLGDVTTSTVTLNGGTLQMAPTLSMVNFSNPFAINAPGGTVDLNGAFVTLSGVISDGAGAGVLNVIDSTGTGSTLELSNANTYTGGTNANTVTLAVANNSSVGTGAVALTNAIFQADSPGDLTFANNFSLSGSNIFDANGVTLTIAGNVTGAGSLEVANGGGTSGFAPGTVVMLGTNTYSGGTFICTCATLQLGDATHTASIVGAVTNEGQFNIVNANTSGITSITNDATFGPGTTTFSNSTSASTMRIDNLDGGATIFNNFSTAGNANIVNHSSGGSTLFFNNSNAGNATITNFSSGGGVPGFPVGLGFFDSSTALNATIVNTNGGFVAFGIPFSVGGFHPSDKPSAGNANITNTNGAEIDFAAFSTAGNAIITTDRSALVEFLDRSTGGNAQFITNGSGVVDFSETTGPHNDGQISAGSIAGSGTYYIGGFNTLSVGGNNLSTEVSGVIADFNPCGCGPAGPGNLEKIGTGTLTLSGTNTYTGITFVNGGTLLVTGSIASSGGVLVDTGATLGGTGIVPLTSLGGGATLAPGLPNALGTLTINDELLFCNCTFYNVKVTSTGSDLTNVVANIGPGIANLEGTVRVTSLNSTYKFNAPYTILTAQGGFDLGSGPTRFDSLMTPTGINGLLSYTSTDVNLTLLSALGQLPGLNINQHNVANALDAAFNAFGSSGNLGAIFNGNIPQNLTQVSGEPATGSQQATFDAMNLFLGLLTDPFIDGRGGPNSPAGGAQPFADDSASAYAANRPNAARDALAKIPTKADAARNNLLDPHWSVWGSAYGGGSSTSGNAGLGSNNATARAFGFVAGADYQVSPTTLAGFALAGGGTNFSVNGLGSGRSDLFQAGAFVRHTVGAAYVSGALAYGWQDVTTDRTVTVAGIDRLHAEFNANAYSGRVEGGYRYITPWMGVTPYAAGQFTTYSLPAYAEQALVGSNAFALNYAAKDVTASRTELGFRTDRSFALQNAILTFRGRLAWAHDFNTDRNIGATFQTLPGASFVVNGAAQAHDSALTTASAELKWINGWSVAATFEGEFSYLTNSYAGKGVVRYVW
jgi:autotransporter-associated beta strand protein